MLHSVYLLLTQLSKNCSRSALQQQVSTTSAGSAAVVVCSALAWLPTFTASAAGAWACSAGCRRRWRRC